MDQNQENSLQVEKSQTLTLPQRLQNTILSLGAKDAESKALAKMDMMDIVSTLMPGGKPQFLQVIKYPKISELVETMSRPKLLLLISIMVRDFCSSVNVVRNMNEDQIIEAAAMLLDECDNFRLEDYTMMFTLAKRGDLVKIYDRVDITVITEMMDNYWKKRKKAAREAQEKRSDQYDSMGTAERNVDTIHPQDDKLMKATDGLAGAMGDLKNRFAEWKNEKPE